MTTERLSEADWKNLLRRIQTGKCTPFIGAGASAGRMPLAREVAQNWAHNHGYPLSDSTDLARVAQFIAIEIDDLRPKEDMAEICAQAQLPDFSDPDEIYGLLADLPLPIYITTNYDDFMTRALKSRHRDPRPEVCRWNRFLELDPSVFATTPTFQPSVAVPLVYHLHGCKDVAQSLVLTEDDYLDFLVRMSRDINLLPAPIVKALAGTSLLFVGYSLSDWNFRVLFRGLIGSMGASLGMRSIAVQLAPLGTDAPASARERAQHYLNAYFEKIQQIPVRVYWGTAAEFAAELRARWETLKVGRPPA